MTTFRVSTIFQQKKCSIILIGWKRFDSNNSKKKLRLYFWLITFSTSKYNPFIFWSFLLLTTFWRFLLLITTFYGTSTSTTVCHTVTASTAWQRSTLSCQLLYLIGRPVSLKMQWNKKERDGWSCPAIIEKKQDKVFNLSSWIQSLLLLAWSSR